MRKAVAGFFLRYELHLMVLVEVVCVHVMNEVMEVMAGPGRIRLMTRQVC
jgi:hypothetical protein